MDRPLIWLAGFFVLGIIFQDLFGLQLPVLFAGALFLLLIAVLFLSKQERPAVFLIFGLALLCGALRLALAESQHISNLAGLSGKRFTVQGVVSSYPEVREDKTVFEVMVDKYKLSTKDWQHIPREKVRFYLFAEEEPGVPGQKLSYGDTITAHGKLVEPGEKRNPGEFDYREYLKFRNIYCLFYIYDTGDLEVKDRSKGNSLAAAALDIRENFARTVRSSLPERQAVLLLAMLFGEQGAVMEEDLKMFRETGIAHALSVSGLHVGLVLLLVLSLCRIAKAGARATMLISICVLCFYCVLCAFTVTVVRATIMGIIGLLAYYYDRERNIYIGLAASGIIILLWNPYFLFDPGFQLSFTAVFAIVYLSPFLRIFLPFFLTGREGLITVPLAAQLGTLPIIAWHFNMVSLLAVLANVLLVPLISAAVIIGVCAFFVFIVSTFAAEILLQSAGFLLKLVILSGGYIARFPGTVTFVVSPPVPIIVCYYFLLVFYKEKLRDFSGITGAFWEKKGAGVPAENVIIFLLIAVVLLFIPFLGGGNLQLYFLDVGQGDALFLRSPSGYTVLIDGGGTPGYLERGYSPGKDTVLPFLHRQGINRLDLMINTHPDEDHLGGLEDVLAAMPVGKVITPPVSQWQDKYADFLDLARQKGTVHLELTRGDRIHLDRDVYIRVLAPGKGEKFESCNDSSLVMQVCYRNNRFLLTGDLEKEGIDSLLEKNEDLHSTVLKIPHHGGKSSFHTGLYENACPRIAVISVGKNNTFGHPAKEVVEYWDGADAYLYRTDRDGCVIVSSDGKNCVVQTVR